MDAARLYRLLKSLPMERNDIQVVVIDDCSPDQAALDVLRLRWPRVYWLSTHLNAGAGVARNIGLDAAQGKWLVFADSDDEFLPRTFEVFDNSLCDGDDLVYFLAEAVHDRDGSESDRCKSSNELIAECAMRSDLDLLKRLRLSNVVPWAKVYSRSFIDLCGIRFDEVRLGNDVAFNVLAAMQAKRVRAVPLFVYRYYRRCSSLTADISAESFMQRFLVSHSVAERLATMGFKKVWPASGMMLQSLKYGPKVAMRVWWLSVRSPMMIEWRRLLDIERWSHFLVNQKIDARERKGN